MEDMRPIRKGCYEDSQKGYRTKGWGVASWEKVKRNGQRKKEWGDYSRRRVQTAGGRERVKGREGDRGTMQARHESS